MDNITDRIKNLSPEQRELFELYLKNEGIELPIDSGFIEENTYTSIKPVEEKDYYEVSSAQKRFYILSSLEDTGTAYNIPYIMEVEGELDKERLEEVFKKLIQRHEAFRTSFEMVNEEPVQKIHKAVDFKIQFEEANEDKEQEIVNQFIRPFDLSIPPLMRVKLVKTGINKHLMLIDIHHIISDGKSVDILVQEITSLYEQKELEGLKIQYKDYAVWQNNQYSADRLKKQEEYWLGVFGGEIPVLNLPTDYPRPSEQSFEGSSISLDIGIKLTEALKAVAEQNGATLNMLLLAAYTVLLHKYTAQDDIIVGCPIEGRSHADLQNMLGAFVNTIAIRSYPSGDKPFNEYLRQVRTNALNAYENQNYQFEKLVEKLGIRRDMGRTPLFDTMFALYNIDIPEFRIKGLSFRPKGVPPKTVKLDLALNAMETGEGISFQFEYCTKLFKEETIQRMSGHFVNLLGEIARNLALKISEMDILSKEERDTLLYRFNNTKAPYAENVTVCEMFEEQAERTPDNTALIYDNKRLTYRELNERANRLARVLRQKGMKPDSIVGMIVERSFEMIIGILGILKAGGAYLPIDPDYPPERIKYMLEDSGAAVLLMDVRVNNVQVIHKPSVQVVYIEDEGGDCTNPEKIHTPGDLAYIIYTSGTTGKPKGVMVEHKNLAAYVNAFLTEFHMDSASVMLQQASYSFDVFVEEVYPALTKGASIVIAKKEEIHDIDLLASLISKEKATITSCSPLLLNELNKLPGTALSVKTFISGGDVLKKEYISNLLECTEVYNTYGPTEATVCASYYRCKRDEDLNNIPIGKPIANCKIYILDKSNKLLPVGVPGELFIAGAGIARGYLNRPGLSAEKFILSPFADGERLYRTGDLARWLADGNIEFWGRVDSQVKIRGYRIELEEIEAELRRHKHIKEAVVIDREDRSGNKFLCAYIVCGSPLTTADLRGYLSQNLPSYMIPSYFIPLDKIPVTPNGKLDRKALPNPDGSAKSSVEYETPRNNREEKLVQIWQEILGAERVGINDNFFDLGGDSIKALQISSRLHGFNMKLEIRELLKNPVIRELSPHIKEYSNKRMPQQEVSGECGLTPIQQWFFDSGFTDMHHWNQAVMLHGKNGFEIEIIKRVFENIVRHHDALRMVYACDGGTVVQYNRGAGEGEPFTLDIIDLRGCSDYAGRLEEEATRLQGSIDISHGPLVKLGLFRTDEGDHLLIAIHHLVVDGVSWRIILDDFSTGYRQALEGNEIKFPDKTASFKEWRERLGEYAESVTVLKEKAYWRRQAESYFDRLPTDFISDKNKIKDNVVIELALEADETQKLLKHANRAYNTEINDILLAALGCALKEWKGLENICIALEGHGREDPVGDTDIKRTVGWFTSMYPVKLNMEGTHDIGHILKSVKEEIRRIPDKGMGYMVLKYITPEDKKQGMDFGTEPEITFNYLGQFDSDSGDGLFGMSRISAGQSMSPEGERRDKLEINGLIAEDRLIMSFYFSKNQYKKETIEALTDIYRDKLVRMIRHCAGKGRTEPTPSDFGDRELTIEELDEISSVLDIENIQSIYPLSPLQEGIFFHALEDRESLAYAGQIAFGVNGEIDAGTLEKSFNKLIERHDALRTRIVYKNLSRSRQVVLKKAESSVYFEDISGMEDGKKDAYIREFKEKDRQKGFDLTRESLIRLSVLKTAEAHYIIVLDNHHIIIDGWCMGIIFKDLFEVYGKLSENKAITLEKSPSYKGYIDWLEMQDSQEAEAYWKNYLDGYESSAGIPKSAFAGRNSVPRQEELNFNINEKITAGLKALAKNNNVTLNTVLQTLWGILLQRYNNTDDVVFGSVVAGRPSEVEGIEKMVGLLINTIPVRIQNGGSTTLSDLLKRVQEESANSQSYSYYPLPEIQSATGLGNGLLDHIVAFENYPIEKIQENDDGSLLKGAEIIPDEVEVFEQTNYDFVVTIMPGDEVGIKFIYNSLVHDPKFIEAVALHFIAAAGQIAGNMEIALCEIDILPDEERYRLLYEFNNTAAQCDSRTIHQLFEEQVRRTPDSTAVVFEDSWLTYGELNDRANRLARTLCEKGVQPDSIVAIMLERSLELAVSALAVWKAGGAYLPVDPTYPEDRIRYILEDSGAGVLLVQKVADRLQWIMDSEKSITVINLEDGNIYCGDGSSLKNTNTSTDLAYIIYTSGTTGRPKGVMIEHRSLVNQLTGLVGAYKFNSTFNFILLARFTFDVSVQNIFLPLISGGKVFIPSERILENPVKLLEFMRDNEINLLNTVPALMEALTECAEEKLQFRYIMVGADVFHVKLYHRIKQAFEAEKIINIYGPTETTINAALHECRGDEASAAMPIGRPLMNYRLYILGRSGKLQPIGVPGELCIAGAGLARGYLNRPEMTAQEFIQDPFVEGGRMYKTGDLVRMMPDGNIEFLGRLDQQVKIRGFRIELGEIESYLLKHDSINDAVVVDREDPDKGKYLCAYFVSQEELSASELKKHLSSELPDYMVPSYFVQLDSIPLTANGKIDRNALPEAEGDGGAEKEYVPPTNEIEQKLAAIWQDVLGADRVGITDNFFDLGGHSLKATVLAARIYKDLNSEVPLSQVFVTPTIQGLAQYIKEAETSIYQSIQPVDDREYYEVSSAQKRLWAIHRMEGAGTAYNIPLVLEADGSLELERLQRAFRRLVQRHEILRTSFEAIDGEPVQKIHNNVAFKIEYAEIDESLIKKVLEEFIQPFDLGIAPLMRVKLLKTGDDRHLLMIDMHHIICDGVSLDILVRELTGLYEGRVLEPLNIQYRDYSAWQNRLLSQGIIKQQEEYWLEQLKGDLPVLDMPTDYPRPPVQSFDGDSVQFRIDRNLLEKLNGLAAETGTTLYMVLLAAYTILLSKYSGQEDIMVGAPTAGRSHADLQNVMGMFVNTIALRTHPEGNRTINEYLGEVKQNVLEAFENQDYQFEELIDKLDTHRDMSRNPLFDTMIVLQNAELSEFKIEGLKFTQCEVPYKKCKFDMTLEAVETFNGMRFELEYCTRLFKRETIQRMTVHFINILEKMVNPQAAISEIDMLSEEEKNTLLYEFNSIQTEYNKDITLHELFEQQAEKTPDNIAVVFGDKKLIYRELNQRSNQLARVLTDKGAMPENVVAIMVDRSIEMAVAILGILKSGGTYLPIDPSYPEERIKYMLEDSGAKMLLTQQHLQGKVEFGGETILFSDISEATNPPNINNPLHLADASLLAYIIYTSGTTGRPKGVMVSHGSISCTIQWRRDEYRLGCDDNVLQLFSYAFDGFLTSFFTPLLSGAKVVMLDEKEAKDPVAIKNHIAADRITHFICVPVLYGAILECGTAAELESLRIVTLAGDKTTDAVVALSKEKNLSLEIVNEYGPTEGTVVATCARNINAASKITIGKPVADTCTYILDKTLKLQPLGVAGEIYLGGVRLAKGYINNPGLTAERFIDNPYMPGQRMYRTGDMAKWLPDGSLEFLGRADQQVKIRGYRIELGEIEARLLSHEQVKEATLAAREDADGNQYICAYIVAEDELTSAELKEYLSMELPDYMIPAYFIRLERFPITTSGKLDRKALPAPDGEIDTGAKYEAPRDATEKALAEIWKDVLGVEKVGINDNFFDLGGHSLKAIVLGARVQKEFDVEISLMQVLKAPTIKLLAQYISMADNYFGYLFSEQTCVLLNEKKSKNVFAFSPLAGTSIAFRGIAALTGAHSFYGFDFIESENLIGEYTDTILQIQNSGPYVLAGYSAGGNIAFEVAKELIKRGHTVSDIIMIDSARKFSKIDIEISRWAIGKMLEGVLEVDEQDEEEMKNMDYFTDLICEKAAQYRRFIEDLVNEGQISSDIHLVEAEESEIEGQADWKNVTTGAVKRYRGIGNHVEMITNSKYLKRNAEIINEILKGNIT